MELTTIKSDGYSMFEASGTRMLVKGDASGYDKYNTYINTKEFTDQDLGQMIFSIGIIQSEIEYETKTSGTYLGRLVDIYKKKVKDDNGYAVLESQTEYFIDKKTGLCLKAKTLSQTSFMGYDAYMKMVVEVVNFNDSGKRSLIR